jgi:hypothetical protein
MPNHQIPKVSTKFSCIIDKGQASLAAVISSYLHIDREYTAIFSFPSVTVEKDKCNVNEIDENNLSVTRAIEFSIRVFKGFKSSMIMLLKMLIMMENRVYWLLLVNSFIY